MGYLSFRLTSMIARPSQTSPTAKWIEHTAFDALHPLRFSPKGHGTLLPVYFVFFLSCRYAFSISLFIYYLIIFIDTLG